MCKALFPCFGPYKINTFIGGQAVKPYPKRHLTIEPLDAAENFQKNLLSHIFGVLLLPGITIADIDNPGPVLIHERLKCRFTLLLQT